MLLKHDVSLSLETRAEQGPCEVENTEWVTAKEWGPRHC
jgi:hypothetical protein